MWCKIKDIDSSYRKFLTPKQLDALGLSSAAAPQGEENNTHSLNRPNEFTKELSDDETIILVIPPYEDLQSELSGCCHSPHKLP